MSPPTRINGRSAVFPAAHHVAGAPKRNADITAARAAGLNRCFFRNAKIYLDTFASKATIISDLRPTASVGVTGEKISASMSAVIKTDSAFVTAPHIHAKSLFADHDAKRSTKTYQRIAMGLYGRMSIALKNTAAARSASR